MYIPYLLQIIYEVLKIVYIILVLLHLEINVFVIH